MRKTLLFASLVVACGGAVVGPIGDGGGTDGTAGGDGGGGSDGSTGNDCDSLLAQINSQQAQLQTCCPTCKSLQCQGTAKGICCPVTINGTEKGSFEALVTKYT